MASKAASEVSKAPTKKRKSGEEYEAPSSSALVAVAATAYASLARGPLAANTEGARKLAAYVGDGVATCVQSLVDSGLQSEDLRGLRTAVALGGLRGQDEAEAGAARSKAQRRDGIQRVVAPSSLNDAESVAAAADAACRLAGRGVRQAGDVARTLAETLFALNTATAKEKPGTRKRGRVKEKAPSSSSEAAACSIARIVLRNDPTARDARKQIMRDAKAVDALHAACRAASCRDAALMSTLEARLAVLKFSAREASSEADKVLAKDLKKALDTAVALVESGEEILSPENARQRTEETEADDGGTSDAPFRACCAVATSVVASSGAPATTRVLATACEAWLAEPPCLEAVASLAVALRLRGELSGDADGPLACALSRWLASDSDGAQRAVRALSRGERLEDFVDAVQEARGPVQPQTPGKGRGRADPLLAARQAHGVDVRGPRALGDRSNAVEDEEPQLSQAY